MSATPPPQQLPRWKIWLLAARPRTLPAAAAPVVVGSAVALRDGVFQPLPALVTLLAALLLQIGSNVANDVFDYKRGADTPNRMGPLRVTQAGLLTPAQTLAGMWVIFGLAALLGVYLIYIAGWPILLVGLSAILAAIAYTGGPLPFGYYGLGDLFVFIFFGLVAVGGTYFIQAGTLTALVVAGAVAMGFLITGILVVNNLRDIETDRAVGKHTLAVRLGAPGARLEFVACMAGAYLVPPLVLALGLASAWVLLAWLSIPLAARLVRELYTLTGRPLNKSLAGAGQLTLVYAILFSLGVLLR